MVFDSPKPWYELVQTKNPGILVFFNRKYIPRTRRLEAAGDVKLTSPIIIERYVMQMFY
jgi:hypothetical protein